MNGLSEENDTSKLSYQFGPFLLDTSRRCLFRQDEVVPLRAKLFELLLTFVESDGRFLSKEDLKRAVWRDYSR